MDDSTVPCSDPGQSWESAYVAARDRYSRRRKLPADALPGAESFPAEYRARIVPGLALRDAVHLNAVLRTGADSADLWRPAHPEDARHLLRIYSAAEHDLDQVMPFLQNLKLRVIDQIQLRLEFEGRRFFIRSFAVAAGVNLTPLRAPLLTALDALLSGRLENDALNALILATGLGWQEIDVFRAYHNYALQLGSRFGRLRFFQALYNHPGVTRLLYRYFESRFRPGGSGDEDVLSAIRQELAARLNEVADSGEDRILRALFNLIDATLRTNFFRRRDDPDYFVALKISGLGVIDMPAPKPLFEIYVHSSAMEGMHLRGAQVARGGIRWSDRPEDFRVEILDLMQTQMIKNALIVPQGAKGGFVLKSPSRDPEECRRQAKAAYATLIRGLLDLTDNLTDRGVTRPPLVVSYDDPDPYLVVAADKGTASFSDIANAIAREYGFWLGDAFASGGSRGYDHKRLGITARGAWECVKRHFAELNRDIEREPFTVVGVGSMDGDVFGNGMLYSQNIRLLAAFSGQHIFLDPDPEPEASYRERKRLFELAGSAWADYDRRAISSGGGVFPREAKDIPLSFSVRAWLGVRHRSIDGEGLVRLLLTAPVDLLWLGGIGTYVKSSKETHEEVGDRVNDAVRVDGIQLRATVVGEGANLGFTQQGRIEFALAGGRINTDAVDNSAGVDLSDHEVNLKILTGLLRERGLLAGEEERDRFLAELTEAVCAAVLRDNYGQSLCLSLERERCLREAEPFMALADRLENAGSLDRVYTSFPGRKELQVRAGRDLVRPELAVLLAHAKLALKRALLASPDFLDAEWSRGLLAEYFPRPVREAYGPVLPKHSLAREITATVICNQVLDQAGSSVLVSIDELEPGMAADLAGAYLCFDAVLDGQALRRKISELEGVVTASQSYRLLLELEAALVICCDWALGDGVRMLPTRAAVETWQSDLADYLDYSETALGDSGQAALAERRAELEGWGFGGREARTWALLARLGDFPILASLARSTGEPLSQVVGLNDRIADRLGLRRCQELLRSVRPRDRWERRAQAALLERLRKGAACLTRMALQTGRPDAADWFGEPQFRPRLARFGKLLNELEETPTPALTPFAVLGAELEAFIDLGRSSGFDGGQR